MKPKDYWNQAADQKEFTTPFQAQEFEAYVKKEGSVLDVGCGYGRTLYELACEGYKDLTGVDFSEKMIARGRRQFPHLKLVVNRGSKLDFPSESMDGVILFAVLTCIVSDEEQKNMLEEIHRVLKPGGIVYVNDFLLNQDQRNLDRYDRFKDQYSYGIFELPEGALLRHHDEKWIKELLSPFQTVKFERLTFTTMNGNCSNGFFYLGRKE